MTTEAMSIDPSAYADVEGLFEDKKQGHGMFLSIFDFQICQRSKAFDTEDEARANLTALLVDDKGWTGPHKTTNPNTKQDRYSASKPYDRMVARIADISKHTKKFDASKGGGKVTNWEIVLLSGGKQMTLQLTYMDHVLKRLLKVLPNIDLTRPVLISAFKSMKNGKPNQAVSFRQYTGDLNDIVSFKNVDKWDKVEEYWQRPLGPDDKPIDGAPSVGADGSILPQPEFDEDEDKWDYKQQNKFLAQYFRDNVLPNIKAIAAQYGLQNEDTEGEVVGGPAGELPTHTGVPQVETPVTERPAVTVATKVTEFASGTHTQRIRQLSAAFGKDPEAVAQALLGCSLTEMTDEAARYVIHKLEERAAKHPPVVAPTPPPAPVPPPAAAEDDLWASSDADIPFNPDPPAAAPVAPAPATDDIEW